VDRRLTARPDDLQVFAFAVSPDGSELAYTDGRGLLRQSIDGAASALIGGGPYHDVDYFPDGQRLLLRGMRDGAEGAWSTALDGTDARLVFEGAVDLVRLSPDGRSLAVADASGLWLRDVADGTRRRVRPLGGADSTAALTWSPSGRALAAIHRSSAGDASAWLEITTVDGRVTRKLLADPRLLSHSLGTLAWLPPDRLVYGLAVGPGEARWMAIDDAEAAADAETAVELRSFSGFAVTQVRASLDGRRAVYSRMQGQVIPYVLDLDAGGPARRLGLEEWNEEPLGWADDGAVWLSSSRLGGTLVRRGLAGGPTEVVLTKPGAVRRIDSLGEDLVFLAVKRAPLRAEIVRARAEDQRAVVSLPLTPGRSEQPQLRCRARCLLGTVDGALHFSWVDLDSGALTPVPGLRTAEDTRDLAWDLSPDGARVAIATPKGVEVHDLHTGRTETWPLDLATPTELVWAPRGDRVFVAGLSYRADTYTVRDVRPDGATSVWSSPSWFLFRLAPSPDGRHLAFAAYAFDDDLWLAEGLAP
jgi:hypothetical protein